jgi:hypothetical protein
MQSVHASVLVLALGSAALAQVPHGSAIVSNFTNAAPMEGVLLVDRSGSATPITGLAASIRANIDINSIQLDPCDDRVWIGGITGSAGRVDTFTVNGSAVAGVTAIGNLGNASSVSGIAFDVNGNAICSSGNIQTTGGLFRVDRKFGTITRIVGGPTWTGQAGTCNAVCSDPDGNLYFAVTLAPGTLYQLPLGPGGVYGAPVAVGTTVPPAANTTISSLEFAPASGVRPARLWFTNFGLAGARTGYIEAGITTLVADTFSSAANWIDYDALNDDFWVLTGGINPDQVFTMNHAGSATLVANVPPGGTNGSPSASDANDDPFLSMKVLPQYVSGIHDIELCVKCPNGSFGGVIMVSPVVFTALQGQAGPDGRVFVKYPNQFVLPGTPGVVTLIPFCFDPTTATLRLGNAERWPRN